MNKALAFALVLAPLAIACGKPYQVVKFATPSPFTRPGCKLVVEEIHYDKLMVGDKPVGQYMAEKKDASADKFDVDMGESSGRFAERVRSENPALTLPNGGTPDNTFVLRSFMTEWEPGFYAYVASRPSEMNMVVDVVDSGGNVLDEIIVRGKQGAGFEGSGTRMRQLADRMGNNVNHYLHDRWLCGGR